MEIGSEFSCLDLGNGCGLRFPNDVSDYCYTFSGRTAIETVLLNEPNIKKILVPSYCCDSMLEPLRNCNIEVCFFSVNFFNKLEIELKIKDDIDAILWCNYFGFINTMPDFSTFIGEGGIIIEDITHSLFSKNACHAQSTYLIASLRKWLPLLCGGYVASRRKKISIKPENPPSLEFLNMRKKAMLYKEKYLLCDKSIDKNSFIEMFYISNNMLAREYSQLGIDVESKSIIDAVNQDIIVGKRKKNAETLYEGIKETSKVKFLFKKNEMDCPLFVPIVVSKDYRDNIKKRLVENNIFCPTHWPKPLAKCESNLYDIEISLVCDQRYSEEDMKKIVKIICEEDGGR